MGGVCEGGEDMGDISELLSRFVASFEGGFEFEFEVEIEIDTCRRILCGEWDVEKEWKMGEAALCC